MFISNVEIKNFRNFKNCVVGYLMNDIIRSSETIFIISFGVDTSNDRTSEAGSPQFIKNF